MRTLIHGEKKFKCGNREDGKVSDRGSGVSVRPFYLPRKFPQIFVTVVYIHPKANAKNAVATIHKVTQKLKSLSPDSPCLILGDFNHCNLKSLSNFYQYISCPTRLTKTIDLCYGSVKGAYKSVSLLLSALQITTLSFSLSV